MTTTHERGVVETYPGVEPGVLLGDFTKLGEMALTDPVEACLRAWTEQVVACPRDDNNPYTMGFMRDAAGKMQPIHGPKVFASLRDLSQYNLLFGADFRREVFLLSSSITPVDSPRVYKGKYWDYLPDNLKDIFGAGDILVTDGHDYYPTPISERFWDEPLGMATVENVDEHVSDSPQSTPLILYTGNYRMGRYNSAEGRTGVVVQTSDKGELNPVTVEIDGQEYLIELKGCGTSEGGFGRLHHRTGRYIVTGGCEATQAVDEIQNLDHNNLAGGSKAAVAITFLNHDKRLSPKLGQPYEQGFIVRFVPSTVRASYARMDAYPDVNNPEYSRAIIKIFAQGLIDGMTAPHPNVLDRSAHSENISLWGGGLYELTDFSDHVPFSHPNYPHTEGRDDFITTKTMLGYFIGRLTEIPGFREAGGYETLKEFLEEAAQGAGLDNLGLHRAADSEQITEAIWQSGYAQAVIDARMQEGYEPQGIWDEVGRNIQKYGGEASVMTERAFIEAADAYIKGLATTMDAIYPNEPYHDIVDGLKNPDYEEKLFLIHVGIVGQAYKRYGPEFKAQYEKLLDMYLILKNTADPIRNYFADELDIVEAAIASASSTKRVAYEAHRAEVVQKIADFNEAFSSPAVYWRLMTDPTNLAKALKLSAYSTKTPVLTK